MNEAWECPRCGRINAPFNPSCFCSPEDGDLHNSAKTPPSPQSSEHVMDAAHYLNPEPLYRILEAEKRKAEIVNGLMPNFYNAAKTKVNLPKNLCLICGVEHNHGQHCATLQNNLPPNGEFI